MRNTGLLIGVFFMGVSLRAGLCAVIFSRSSAAASRVSRTGKRISASIPNADYSLCYARSNTLKKFEVSGLRFYV